MTRLLLIFILLALSLSHIHAQTVIDLHRGGVTARAKNRTDYDTQHRSPELLRRDSLEYVDCLTRAFNYLHTDSLIPARQCLERALRLRPDAPGNYIVRSQLGQIAMTEGRYAEAVSEFDRVLRERPGEYDIRRLRATCYMERQMPQQALEDCRTLFRQTTDTTAAVEILFLQSAAHRQMRQYTQVGEDLQHILRLMPLNTSATLLYALNLESLGQPQEAINRLNLYVSAHPHDIEGLTARAQVLLRQGLKVLALEDVQTALRLEPHNPTLVALKRELTGKKCKKF